MVGYGKLHFLACSACFLCFSHFSCCKHHLFKLILTQNLQFLNLVGWLKKVSSHFYAYHCFHTFLCIPLFSHIFIHTTIQLITYCIDFSMYNAKSYMELFYSFAKIWMTTSISTSINCYINEWFILAHDQTSIQTEGTSHILEVLIDDFLFFFFFFIL